MPKVALEDQAKARTMYHPSLSLKPQAHNNEARPPIRRALLVGIDYEDPTERLCANKDVENIRRTLIEARNYHPQDITVMGDSPGTAPDLIPTKRKILHQLKKLVRGARSGDQFFFFYAGHGDQSQCDSGTESDGMDECIRCADGRLLKDNDLRAALVNKLPPGASLFALFDTCHSGTMLDLPHRVCNGETHFTRYINRRLPTYFRPPTISHSVSDSALDSLSPVTPTTIEESLPPLVHCASPTMDSTPLPTPSPACDAFDAAQIVDPSESRDFGSLPRKSRKKCDGNCFTNEANLPLIVSLSSTRDNEQSFEGPQGGPLSSAFADVLRHSDDSLTYEDLMTKLGDRFVQSFKERYDWCVRTPGYTVDDCGQPQHPVLSSLSPLNILDKLLF
jgi:hypothetical protein